MDLHVAISLGAAGGALVEAIALSARINEWKNARQQVRDGGGTELPRFSRFIDLPVVAAVAVTRLLLGAAAGGLFHDQLVGFSAAIAVGASGPAILQQLGTFQSVREAVQGAEPVLVNESETTR